MLAITLYTNLAIYCPLVQILNKDLHYTQLLLIKLLALGSVLPTWFYHFLEDQTTGDLELELLDQ